MKDRQVIVDPPIKFKIKPKSGTAKQTKTSSTITNDLNTILCQQNSASKYGFLDFSKCFSFNFVHENYFFLNFEIYYLNIYLSFKHPLATFF